MRTVDLREKSVIELREEVNALRNEEFNLRMQMGGDQSVSYARFRQIRRDIARIKTIMRQRLDVQK